MKAVLISVRPEWCEKIAHGEKTIEVRKTRPKLYTPFKCYIYRTLPKSGDWCEKDGKVIGEFVCDYIKCIPPEMFVVKEDAESVLQGSCLTPKEAKKYAGWKRGAYLSECKDLYGWRISDLAIYDKPKELTEFTPSCNYGEGGECARHRECECYFQRADYNQDGSVNIVQCTKRVTRPPQSWCYVEELT